MTKETRELLYKHYKEIGYTAALNDLLSRHPELEDKPEVKKDGKKSKR